MTGGRLLLILVAATSLVAGCGDDLPNPVPDDRRRNVMLIDDGIDQAASVFEGKVRVAHTLECEEGPSPDAGQSDKAALLAELSRPDESCGLRVGIDAKPAFGEGWAADARERWNGAVRSGSLIKLLASSGNLQQSELEMIAEALSNEVGSDKRFHGTATGSVLAHEVPYLDLVLVEEEIGSIEDFADEITCLTQEEADLTATLLSDPEVRAAYLQRPLSRQERELRELRAAHGVAVVNESFGPISRFGLEELLFRAGCPLVFLDRYFEVEAELQREYERAHPEPGVLFVRAAGNESSVLSGSTDTLQCRPADLSQVLVGGYGPFGERSSFTNFGPCVDVYAPGELVVGVLPGGWLFPLSGTSFSTPLISRLLVFESPAPFSAESARAALLALREPNRNIPRRYFPPDLALDAVALLLSISEGVSGAPTMLRGPTERVSRAALRKALWPLRWVQRSRGLNR